MACFPFKSLVQLFYRINSFSPYLWEENNVTPVGIVLKAKTNKQTNPESSLGMITYAAILALRRPKQKDLELDFSHLESNANGLKNKQQQQNQTRFGDVDH